MREKHKKEKKEKEVQERIAMRGDIRRLKEILREKLGKKSCMVEIFQLNWNTMTWRMIKRSSARTYLKLLEVVVDNTSTAEDRYRIEFTPLYQLDSDGKEKKTDNAEGQKKERVKVGDVEGEEKGRDVERVEKGRDVERVEKSGDVEGEEKGRDVERVEKSGDVERVEKSGDVERVEKSGDVERVEKVEHVQEIKEEEIECPRCGGKNIKTWSTVHIIKTRSGDRKLRHRCTDCNETFSDEDLGISR